MYKTALLTAASVIALCAGAASGNGLVTPAHPSRFNPFQLPKGATVLWNQNSNDAGDFVSSQYFTSGSTQFDAQGVDDFVIPAHQSWRITEVDVTGVYFVGSGPATSENVIFYKNTNGMPGNPVTKGTFNDLNGTGGPDFAIQLPGRGLRLHAGRYWVSILENADEFYQGAWGWEVNNHLHGRQAMWQNPGGYYGECKTWETIDDCYQLNGPDLMFTLRGHVQTN